MFIENRKDVKIVVCDMYEPYLLVVKRIFLNAKYVVDRFHYVRYIMDTLRIRLQKKYSDNTSSVGTGDDLAPIIVISAYVDSNLAKKMITLNLFDSKLNEKLKEIFNS